MLSGYAKNGRFCDVVDVFEAMPEKNIMSHNAMLSLYLGIGDFISARQVFDEKGHGIDVYLMNEIKNITREYFHQPLAEKNKIKLSAETGYRGYQKIGENITKEIPDILEAIGCYREVKHGMYGDLGAVMQGSNKWPSYPPSFKQAMEEYIDRFTCALLCISSAALIPRSDLVVVYRGFYLQRSPGWSEYLVDFGGLLVNFTSGGGCRTVPEACSFPSRGFDTGESFRFHTKTSSNLNDNFPVDVSCIWSEIYLKTYVGLLEPNFDTAIKPLDVCLQKTDMTDLVWDVAILRDAIRELQKEVHDFHWELAAVRVRMLREIRRLQRVLLLLFEDWPAGHTNNNDVNNDDNNN
ncbi:green ripe-like 1 [Capsicum annuum]|nr:green ripe-like 1 [Capsicum annuum]KAF3618177.1 green ripe-like 1 [Capsicum annuum]